MKIFKLVGARMLVKSVYLDFEYLRRLHDLLTSRKISVKRKLSTFL
jgi:hypothetical protein